MGRGCGERSSEMQGSSWIPPARADTGGEQITPRQSLQEREESRKENVRKPRGTGAGTAAGPRCVLPQSAMGKKKRDRRRRQGREGRGEHQHLWFSEETFTSAFV